MHFKTKLQDVNLFLRLITVIHKISNTSVIQITPTKVRFIAIDNMVDGFQVWLGIDQNLLFTDFDFESGNQLISLELDLGNLIRALKSSYLANNIILKLYRKKEIAYLSFLIEFNQAQSLIVQHDVPLQIMSYSKLLNLNEPSLPNPDVYIMMPSSKVLRSMVERMKNIDQYIYVSANMNGMFTLRVQNELSCISSLFDGLEHPQVAGQTTPLKRSDKIYTVKVENKKLYKSLHSYQIAQSDLICCIFEKQALVLHSSAGGLFITYYIPVIINDD